MYLHFKPLQKCIEIYYDNKKYLFALTDGFKGISLLNEFLICFSLPQGHPRCSRCLCFHSIFNFNIFWSNRCCLSVSHRSMGIS